MKAVFIKNNLTTWTFSSVTEAKKHLKAVEGDDIRTDTGKVRLIYDRGLDLEAIDKARQLFERDSG